jgi:hypothetical protein
MEQFLKVKLIQIDKIELQASYRWFDFFACKIQGISTGYFTRP